MRFCSNQNLILIALLLQIIMTKIKMGSAVVFLVTSITTASAMDMMDTMATSSATMKMTTKNEMMPDTSMYEMVSKTSKKGDISKLQMMLTEKGYLVMPHGVAYGYYGNLTTKAFAKYKKASMMTKDNSMTAHGKIMSGDGTMQGTGTMMMNH